MVKVELELSKQGNNKISLEKDIKLDSEGINHFEKNEDITKLIE